VLGFVAESVNAVAAVESNSDLFIGVDETLELTVQLNVLASQNIAVVLKGVDLGAAVSILTVQRLCRKTKVVLLASVCS
jgi:hypothetical protein